MTDATETPAGMTLPAIKLLWDLVLVEPVDGDAGGTIGKLMIPTAATTWVRRARVVAVGQGKLAPGTGQWVPFAVKPGDVVLHRKQTAEIEKATTVVLGGRAYQVLKADDLIGIVPA